MYTVLGVEMLILIEIKLSFKAIFERDVNANLIYSKYISQDIYYRNNLSLQACNDSVGIIVLASDR